MPAGSGASPPEDPPAVRVFGDARCVYAAGAWWMNNRM